MIEISIDKQIIELSDNASITLSSTLRTIGKIETLDGEYSFSFDIPTTPKNNKILGFKNDLDTLNKFNANYKVLINIDDAQIFEGSLLINSITKDSYSCNVYINKINTISEIFGDARLTDIQWEIEYKQDITINEENAKENPEVIFPLISYGQFQKEQKDGKYISIFSIDDSTKLYNENFLPAPNLLTLVKKCFALKGYNVGGDVFNNENIQKIYLSTNISDKQDFIYPYGKNYDGGGNGKKSMGYCRVVGYFTNYYGNDTYRNQASHITGDLSEPQFQIRAQTSSQYNWTKYNSYNIWNIITNEGGRGFGTIDVVDPDGEDKTSMWRQNRIVIPTDGYYKIQLKSEYIPGSSFGGFNSIGRDLKFMLWKTPDRHRPPELTEYSFKNNSDQMFVEVHLLKNTDFAEYKPIIPYTYMQYMMNWETGAAYRAYNEYPVYPHEPKDKWEESTEANPYPGGYCPQYLNCLAYDPSVNPNFIMGFTKSNLYKFTSVIKNGRSWDSTCADVNYVKTNVPPYYGIRLESQSGSGRLGFKRTPELTSDYQSNNLRNGSSNTIDDNNYSFQTNIEAIVYLKKNDWLQLHMITRKFDNPVSPEGANRNSDDIDDAYVGFPFEIKVSAFGDKSSNLDDDDYFDYNTPSHFPTKLQIGSFLNSETKISDFIENFIKTFNLSYSQNNNTVYFNLQKNNKQNTSTIDLTNRIIKYDFEKIEFPYSMHLKFDINEDEYGYVNSVPSDKIDLPDWKDYADVGSEKIILNGMEGEDEVKSDFSYCWYKDFNVKTANYNGQITIPVIAKDEWMTDGYKVEDNMKNDGYSLKQRMFFKGIQDNNITYGLYNINGDLQIKHLPLYNVNNNFELSFKKQTTSNQTILTNYFDTDYATNIHYFNLTCYITAQEYNLLKNGTNVIFNDNEYQVVEIEYSSDGECNLKLITL